MIHNLLHTLPVSLIFCTIVMGFLLMYERKKHAREAKRRENNFWQRENEANFTRRKDISQLPYIKIPYDSLNTRKSSYPSRIPSFLIYPACQTRILSLCMA